MRVRLWAALWAASVIAASPAGAQVPPPASGEAADIASCLCLRQTIDASSADLAAKQSAYQSLQVELTRLDERLQRERASIDVDNPEAVARFKELLGRRDTAFRRSTNEAAPALSAATARYNGQTEEYNARCANRPRNADLLAHVQATLVCPAPR
jgi:hypothetical protein